MILVVMLVIVAIVIWITIRDSTALLARRALQLAQRIPLLVVQQDLQLDRQIHLPDRDPFRDREHRRREVQDRTDPGLHHAIRDVLRVRRRRRDHADRDPLRANELGQIVEVPYLHPVEAAADLRGIHVDQHRHTEPALGEPLVPGERLTKVADARDQDGPVLGQPEGLPDLVDQMSHVVADPSGAVGAQVGKVLADVGARDPGGVGEDVRRHRRLTLVGKLHEHPQVEREPGHGGVGDWPGGHRGEPRSAIA